jgi:hypothetical protein
VQCRIAECAHTLHTVLWPQVASKGPRPPAQVLSASLPWRAPIRPKSSDGTWNHHPSKSDSERVTCDDASQIVKLLAKSVIFAAITIRVPTSIVSRVAGGGSFGIANAFRARCDSARLGTDEPDSSGERCAKDGSTHQRIGSRGGHYLLTLALARPKIFVRRRSS